MLYDKWWKSPGDTCMRTEKGKESKANSLGVDNIGMPRSQCKLTLCRYSNNTLERSRYFWYSKCGVVSDLS